MQTIPAASSPDYSVTNPRISDQIHNLVLPQNFRQPREAKNPAVMFSVFQAAKEDEPSVSEIDEITDQVLTIV